MASCPACGAEVSDQGVFCPKCGADLQARASVSDLTAPAPEPAAPAPASAVSDVPGAPRNPGLFSLSLNGRSPRAKFWILFAVFQGIGAVVAPPLVAILICAGVMTLPSHPGGPFPVVFFLQCLCAGALLGLVVNAFYSIFLMPMAVRRWHDLDRTGWFVVLFGLLGFVPLLGIVAPFVQILILGCVAGRPRVNRFGVPTGRVCEPGPVPPAFVRERAVPLWICFWVLKIAEIVFCACIFLFQMRMLMGLAEQ